MAIPLDSRFVPAFSIEDVLLDKDTGAPLSGGLVYFEQDNQRGVPKPIYQITGTSPNYTFTQLPNPMTLSSIGTFLDALDNPVVPYFFPYDENGDVEYYYVRVTSALGVEQFVREAVPYVGTEDNTEVLSVITNELSNPQFVETFFTGTYVYNFSGVSEEVVNIAPDWDLIVTCPTTGTVTLTQATPTGSLNIPTNPGTILTIASAGITALKLRQRIYGSPNLWGSGYLSCTYVAKTYSGTEVALNMYYSQSDGTVVNQQFLPDAILPATGYQQFYGTALIPASSSTESYPDAYIDIYFDVPLSIQIDITSVMVAFTGATSIANISYDQESLPRQIDHLFHYYKPELEFKPIPSMLTGWDFNLNPAQFLGGSTQTMTTTAAYVWDQTICKSTVGNVVVMRDAVTGGFQTTTTNPAEAFYMIQYLSGAQARQLVGTDLSVNLSAFRTQAGGTVTAKVYLYRGSSAASIPTLPTTIGTMDATGTFTLTASNWTLIPRGSYGQAEGNLQTVTTTDYSTLNIDDDLKFSGWEIIDSAEIADTDKFAIVVTFQCPTIATVMTLDSVALVAGSIPTRPAPQTRQQVIEECEYYFEKSTNQGVFPSTGSAAGALLCEQYGTQITAGQFNISPRAFSIQYNTKKRASVTPVIYSVVGTVSNVSVFGYQGAANTIAGVNASILNWTASEIGERGCTFIPGNRAVAIASVATGGFVQETAEGFILFHYFVDCRLGVV